jgi:phosphoserine phosphatase
MRALRQQGADVFIISASPQVFVEEVAQFAGLTFLVPKSNVYGVRFTFADSKFTGQLVGGDYPITWGPGKAVIVDKFLKPTHNGKAPIYASGDSNGDCDFMAMVRDGVVHVNNRLKSVCIEEYYEKSCQYFGTKDALNNRYLLQGQDKVIGSWIPTGYTTKDGVTYTVGTTTFTNCSSYALQK